MLGSVDLLSDPILQGPDGPDGLPASLLVCYEYYVSGVGLLLCVYNMPSCRVSVVRMSFQHCCFGDNP